MYLYVLLLILLIILWYCAFQCSNHELLSPASLNTIMFGFTVLCCITGYGRWNTWALDIEGFAILLIGCIGFVFGCIICGSKASESRIFFHKELRNNNNEVEFCPSLSLGHYMFIYGVSVLWLFSRFMNVFNLANTLDYESNSIIDIFKYVRYNSGAFGSTGIRLGEGSGLLLRQLLKLDSFCIYGSVIFLTYNIYYKRKKQIIYSSIWTMMCWIALFTTGGRGAYINYFLAIILAYFIIELQNGQNPMKIAMRYIKIGFFVVIVGLPLFYFSSALVGRKAGGNMVDYLTFYFGAGIPSMQQLIDDGVSISNGFGTHTFYGVHVFLYKLNLQSELTGFAGYWVSLNGFRSNIYTAWYRYYADFGMLGVIIFPALSGWIYTKLYHFVVEKKNLPMLCLYLSLGVNLFDLSRDEWLFANNLTSTSWILSAIVELMLMYLITYQWHAVYFNTPQLKTNIR